MPISNVSGSNFTTLYSSQGNANPYVPLPPSNANVSGQNYTTLYSSGSGTAPVPMATYGNANVESFLAVGSDTGGNTVGNIVSSGAISATGNITTDQYFIGTFLGNITGNFVVPGLNTQVIYNNNGNAGASSGLTFVATSNTLTSGNVVSAVGNIQGGNIRTAGQVSATGNVTGNYFIGNGSQLTGLPATYGNANVANFLASGNNTSNITTTANVTGTYILGNGSQLTGLPATYSNANVTTLLANFGSNVISTTGNVTAGYFIGNGSTLTNLTAGNIVGTVANAAYALNANAATYATNAIQANVANVANSVAGANVTGTVANATYALNANASTYSTNAIQANVANVANSVAGANVTGTVANATYALNSNAATFAGTVTTNAQPNITSVGILTVINTSGNISATGNITGNVFTGNGAGLTNINAANIIGAYGNANVAANLAAFANNPISTSGNITAGYFIGNGVALTSLTGANVTGVVANATYAVNANAATYATDAVQANYANIANSVAGANVSGTVGLAQYVTQNAQANITSVGILTSLSVSGNITTGNLTTAGNVTADYFIGNIAGNVSGNSISVSGNITGGNLLTNGQVSAAGNITGNYIIGNGSLLTSLTGANVTGTVDLAQYVTQNAQANITSVGTLTSLSVSGNVTAGNVVTSGTGLLVGNVFSEVAAGTTAAVLTARMAADDTFRIAVGGTLDSGFVEIATADSGTEPIYVRQYQFSGPDPFGSLVRSLTLLDGAGNTSLPGNLSVVGNINGANLNISNDALILGNLTVNGNTTFINSNVVTINDKFINLANNAANASAANGGGIGIGPIASEYATLTYDYLANVWTTNIGISVTGNITGNVFLGNGSGLTSLTGANVTGTVANATYALNANAATFAGTVTTNAQPNITSVGILTAVNTSGDISATGNITGNVFTGNAAGLTNIPGGNVTGVVPLAQYVTQNAQANITSVGTLTALSVSGNINTGNINTANYVAFGTTGAQTTAATGQMFWDATEQTVSLGMNNGVTQQIGLENYILVKASATISNGQAVMFTGAAGDNVQAAPADTTSVGFRPEYIIGVATQDIALNAFGYITTFGKVRGLNTLAYTVGDILWVSNATPGALTATQPTDPNYQIEVAAVTKVSGGDGQILVRVTPFNGLGSLTDVTITTPSTGQALVYSGNVWINGNPQQANIANVANSVAGANVTGTVANAAYATSAGSATTATTANTVTDAAQGNITSVGTLTSLSVSGNVNGGNLRTAGQVTATGNVSGGNVIVPVNGRYYGDFTTGTASGRTAFQTTATGTTAATSLTAIPGVNHTTSNTAFSSQLNLFASTDVGNSSFSRMQQLGNRLVFGTSSTGTGTAGNIQIAAGSAQIWLLTTGNVGIGNSNPQHTLAVQGNAYIGTDLSVIGNISLGGDFSTANLSVTNINPASTFGVTVNSEMFVYGNLLPFGNVLMQPNQVLYGETIQLSALGNGTGSLSAAGNITGGNINTGGVVSATGNVISGNVNTGIVSATGNVIGGNLTTTGQSTLGALKTFSQNQYTLGSSGTINIDKNNGQVQYIAASGNVTIGSFSNFVTTAGSGNQTDTVTVIIRQGSPTSYTITMPTGNASIKYAANLTTVGTTANSVTMFNITAANVASVPLYMITISPEFI